VARWRYGATQRRQHGDGPVLKRDGSYRLYTGDNYSPTTLVVYGNLGDEGAARSERRPASAHARAEAGEPAHERRDRR
jgi:hypothetical protein